MICVCRQIVAVVQIIRMVLNQIRPITSNNITPIEENDTKKIITLNHQQLIENGMCVCN